jgi:hypothetical protein
MEQKKISFEDQLSIGKEGEKDIAIYLIEKDCFVLPLYQFDDDISPKIISINEDLFSPDLLCYKENKSFFIEVKSKKKWNEWNGIIETGCNYKHYEHYKKLAIKTGIKLYMIFNHIEGGYKGKYLVDIFKKGRYWDGKNDKGIIKEKPLYFWNKEDLKQLI